jgi:hypothetical protein
MARSVTYALLHLHDTERDVTHRYVLGELATVKRAMTCLDISSTVVIFTLNA